MRKKKSAINMFVGVFVQIEIALVGILNRKFFIHNLSIDYLGCNAVFVNILEILSLVCCGASAISYLMIKAITSDDEVKIQKAFKINHIYQWTVCGLLVWCGFIASFFLPGLLEDATGFEWKLLRVVYLLFLADICITNWSGISGSPGYYDCIIKIAQDSAVCSVFDFIVKNIYMIGQCIVLVYTRNYILYLAVAVLSKLIYIFLTRIYCYKRFPFLKEKICVTYEQIKETNIFAEIRNNIAIMIAMVVFNGTDNIVIMKFLGITAVGLYSNYQTIYNQLRGLISKFINGMSMSVADYIHRTPGDESKTDLLYKIQFLCNSIGLVSSCCFFSCIQPFITIVFGDNLLLETVVVFMISMLLFLNVLGIGSAMFRHAMGKYWLDRNCQLISAGVNLAVSLFLVRIMGFSGILIGTILGNLVAFQGYLKVIKIEAIHSFIIVKWWIQAVVWSVLMVAALIMAGFVLNNVKYTMIGILIRLIGAVIISCIFISGICIVSEKNRISAIFYINQIRKITVKIGSLFRKQS